MNLCSEVTCDTMKTKQRREYEKGGRIVLGLSPIFFLTSCGGGMDIWPYRDLPDATDVYFVFDNGGPMRSKVIFSLLRKASLKI